MFRWLGRRGKRQEAEPDCIEVREHGSDYLEQSLEPSLMDKVRKHLGLCENCTSFIKSLAQTLGLMRSLPQSPMSEELKARLRQIAKKAP